MTVSLLGVHAAEAPYDPSIASDREHFACNRVSLRISVCETFPILNRHDLTLQVSRVCQKIPQAEPCDVSSPEGSVLNPSIRR